MKTIEEKAQEIYLTRIGISEFSSKSYTNKQVAIIERELFKLGVEFAQRWIPVEKTLPSVKNGFIDEDVLVCVKNKNKEDGILLFDISSFDGETWSKRHHTWEKIIGWRAIELK